jgi:hypothetical protein
VTVVGLISGSASIGCIQDSWLVSTRTSAGTRPPYSPWQVPNRTNGAVTGVRTCQETII